MLLSDQSCRSRTLMPSQAKAHTCLGLRHPRLQPTAMSAEMQGAGDLVGALGSKQQSNSPADGPTWAGAWDGWLSSRALAGAWWPCQRGCSILPPAPPHNQQHSRLNSQNTSDRQYFRELAEQVQRRPCLTVHGPRPPSPGSASHSPRDLWGGGDVKQRECRPGYMTTAHSTTGRRSELGRRQLLQLLPRGSALQLGAQPSKNPGGHGQGGKSPSPSEKKAGVPRDGDDGVCGYIVSVV